MDFHHLTAQRRSHSGWRLLAADHAPLIASFLHAAFIAPNARAISRQQLGSQLDDYLFKLHEAAGETLFPKAATAYLDDWASDERAWLRKYYPQGADEAHFDLAPSTEQAIGWLGKMDQRAFIGTESRLATVFSLLREIADGSELDPRARIAELKRRRAAIDAEIADVEEGRLALMDAARVRERFLQMAATARELLSDFRAIDGSFRTLDRQVREHIAGWDGSKGELLQAMFGERDLLGETDEGQSFRAFWDLLMSPARQDELSALLDLVLKLPAVKELAPDKRLRRIHYDLLEAGEVTQQTMARISSQLRRYLNDQAWLENRRIMQLIRDVEHKALALRGQVPERAFMEIDDSAPTFGVPMDRTLYSPPFKPKITQRSVDEGAPLASPALYEQVAVDPLRLSGNIKRALQVRRQVSLATLVAEYPIEQGLAELAAYMKLATGDVQAAIDDERTETVTWIDERGQARRATLPLIIYAV